MAGFPLSTPVKPLTPTSDDAVELEAEFMQPVLAPEAGVVVYIGDGTEGPWAHNAPGVLALLADEPRGSSKHRTLHVLGYLDANALRLLWEQGLRQWGYTAPLIKRGGLSGLVWDLHNMLTLDEQRKGRPHVEEGAPIAYVSSRARLRWQVYSTEGVPVTFPPPSATTDVTVPGQPYLAFEPVPPMTWANENGISNTAEPSYGVQTPDPAPAPAPAAEAPAAEETTDNSALVVLAVIGGGIVLARRRRRRR